jgi:hypothetical protein
MYVLICIIIILSVLLYLFYNKNKNEKFENINIYFMSFADNKYSNTLDRIGI